MNKPLGEFMNRSLLCTCACFVMASFNVYWMLTCHITSSIPKPAQRSWNSSMPIKPLPLVSHLLKSCSSLTLFDIFLLADSLSASKPASQPALLHCLTYISIKGGVKCDSITNYLSIVPSLNSITTRIIHSLATLLRTLNCTPLVTPPQQCLHTCTKAWPCFQHRCTHSQPWPM